MFGLEKQKKGLHEEFVFELEKELKSPSKNKALKQQAEARIQRIKEILRSGEDQQEFDQLGLLLHGYHSLIKVMSRFSKK